LRLVPERLPRGRTDSGADALVGFDDGADGAEAVGYVEVAVAGAGGDADRAALLVSFEVPVVVAAGGADQIAAKSVCFPLSGATDRDLSQRGRGLHDTVPTTAETQILL
jgi:hypothetical protein